VTCIHLLLSVYIEYYNFNTVFSFLKMRIHFLAPSVYARLRHIREDPARQYMEPSGTSHDQNDDIMN
jgi:hypothetical protein